jgi:predicted kinase
MNDMNDQLSIDYSNLPQPILILIRGLPGSGKSYLATALQKALGNAPVVALDPDAVDLNSQAYADHVKAATVEGVDPKIHLYRFLRAQAWDGIVAHKIIIWNQPFTNLDVFRKMTSGLKAYAVEHGTELRILVVEVGIDSEIANARIAERKQAGGHGPSDVTFTRFATEYTSFAPEGHATLEVLGHGDTAESVKVILDRVAKLVTN